MRKLTDSKKIFVICVIFDSTLQTILFHRFITQNMTWGKFLKGEIMLFKARVLLVAVILCSSLTIADFGQMFTYQGKLTDGTGLPTESAVDMTFTLYTASTAGSVVWSKTILGVDPEHGIFSVELDISTGTPTSVDWDAYPELWLQVNVDGTDLSPRERLTSAFHAFNIADGIVTASKLADGTAPGQVYQFDGSDWNLVDGSSIGSNSLQEAYDGGSTIEATVAGGNVAISNNATEAVTPLVVMSDVGTNEAAYFGNTDGGNAIKTGGGTNSGNIWMETGNIQMDAGNVTLADGKISATDATGDPIIYAANTGAGNAVQLSGGNFWMQTGNAVISSGQLNVTSNDGGVEAIYAVNTDGGNAIVTGVSSATPGDNSGSVWISNGNLQIDEGQLSIFADSPAGTEKTFNVDSDGNVYVRGDIYAEGATDDANETRLTFVDPTALRSATFPDASGEVSLLGQSIESSEILDGTIAEVDLNASGSLTDGFLLSYDAGSFQWIDPAGVGGLPGGNIGNIQFNNAGSFAGSNNLQWDAANSRLGIGTTAPGYPLDIQASVANQDLLRLSHPTAPADAGFVIGFNTDGSTDNNVVSMGVEYSSTDYDVINIKRSDRNVGIGTTDPDFALDVRSAIGVSTADEAEFLILNATASGQQIRFSNTSHLEFGAGSGYSGIGSYTEIMRIDGANRRLGLGTSSPAHLLDVYDSSPAVGRTARIRNTVDAAGEHGMLVSTARDASDAYIFQAASAGGTNSRLYIRSDGNIGIGTTTPSAQLHTTGTLLFSGAGTPAVGRVLTSDASGNATWQDPPSVPSDNVTGTGTATRVAFWDGANTITSNANLYWNNTNNRLGIGTATPGVRLDVQTPGYGLPENSGSNQTYGGVRVSPPSSSGNVVLDVGTAGATGVWLQTTLRTDLANTYPLLLNPNGGNVGIGTSAPNQRLHVSGDVNLSSGQGYRINNTAGSGQFLRGNGTRFVSSAIQAGDIPAGSNHYIQNLSGIGTAPQEARWRLSWPYTLNNQTDTLTYLICNPASWNSDAVIYGNLIDIGTVTDGHGQAYRGRVDGSYSSLTGTASFSGAMFSAWDAAGNTRGASGGVNISTLRTSFANHDATAYGLSGTATGDALSPSAVVGADRMAVVGVHSEIGGTINNPATMPDTFRVAALWAVDNKTGGTATSYAGYFDGDVYIDGNLNVTGSGGGSSNWTVIGSDIYRLSNVGIGNSSPSYKLDVVSGSDATPIYGYKTTGSGNTAGVEGASSTRNIGRLGGENLTGDPIGSSYNYGVYGYTDGAGWGGIAGVFRNTTGNWAILGSNMSGYNYAGYFNGNVGITGGLYDGASTGSANQVLTADGAGGFAWATPASGADADWTVNGVNQYSAVSGNVGIGTNSPGTKLDVSGVARFGSTTNGNVSMGNDGNAYIELRESDGAGTPYIDFSNDAFIDYDARIRLTGDDQLTIEGASLVASNNYLNFGTIGGSGGYGFRSDAGTVQYKNSGGSWVGMPDVSLPGGTAEWWFRPDLDPTYIRPYTNEHARVYDAGEDVAYFYEGSNYNGSFFAGGDVGVVGQRSGVSYSEIPSFIWDEFPFVDVNSDGSITSDDNISYTGIYGYGSVYMGVTGVAELDAGVRGIALDALGGTNSTWPLVGVIGEVVETGSWDYGQQGVYGFQAATPGAAEFCSGVYGRTSQTGYFSAGVLGQYTASVTDPIDGFDGLDAADIWGGLGYGGYVGAYGLSNSGFGAGVVGEAVSPCIYGVYSFGHTAIDASSDPTQWYYEGVSTGGIRFNGTNMQYSNDGLAWNNIGSGGGTSPWTDAGNYLYPNGGIGTNLQIADVQSHTYGMYSSMLNNCNTGASPYYGYGGYFDNNWNTTSDYASPVGVYARGRHTYGTSWGWYATAKGVLAEAINTGGAARGIEANATAYTSYGPAYGGHFTATSSGGSSHPTYGIYATASGGSAAWAGYFSGNVATLGKLVVNNSVDGGPTRGIWLWSSADPNWGIYMGQSGSNRSLANGTATAGAGFSAHAIRLRTANSVSQGILFENSSEQLNFSVRGSDGLAYFRGNVGIGTTAPATQLHTTGGVRFAGIGGSGAHLTIDASGNITRTTISGGGGTPGGANGNVQFNNWGSFAGSNNLYWDNGNARLGIGTTGPAASLHIISPNLTGNQVTMRIGPIGGGSSTVSRPSILDFWSTFDNFSTDQGPRRTASIRAGFNGSPWGSEYLSFHVGGATDAANLPTERMRINGNGTLTIGAYTLPATDGTSGQVLTTNGSGTVTWQDGGGGSGVTYCTSPGCGSLDAGSLTPTSSVQYAAYSSGTIPYWQFEGTSGTTYNFSLCSNSEDSYLRIYDSDCNIVASNDDNGAHCSGVPASIAWSCPSNGGYVVTASGYSCATFSNTSSMAYWTSSRRSSEYSEEGFGEQAEVYAKGRGMLVSGNASVDFPSKFSSLIGDEMPVVVVTPTGPCNTIYVDSVDRSGFSVVENHGASNTAFNWVAISDPPKPSWIDEHFEDRIYLKDMFYDHPLARTYDDWVMIFAEYGIEFPFSIEDYNKQIEKHREKEATE